MMHRAVFLGLFLVLAATMDRPVGADDPPPPEPAPEGSFEGFRGIRVHADERRLEVEGAICLQQGLLELLACTAGGKAHESLLILGCDPRELNAALLLIGLERTPAPYEPGEARALEGDLVDIDVCWETETGPVRHRAEDLLSYVPDGTTMPRAGWVYVGSKVVELPYYEPDENGSMVYRGERRYFLAAETGNLIAIYHDPACILDTPLLLGGDDTIFFANSDLLPEPGTPVTVHVVARASPEPPSPDPGGETGPAPGGQGTEPPPPPEEDHGG